MGENFGGEMDDMIYIENKFCKNMTDEYYS